MAEKFDPEKHFEPIGSDGSSEHSEDIPFAPLSDEEKQDVGNFVGLNEPSISAPQAALEGAKQGATFGFADELSGLQGAAMENPSILAAMVPGLGDFVKPNPNEDLLKSYRDYRDMARKQTQMAEQQQPLATTLGGLAGGFVVPGGALAGTAGKELSLLNKITKGAKIGAGYGALAGAGTSGAELVPQENQPAEPRQLFENVGEGMVGGAVVGGGIPAITEGVPQGIEATKNLLREFKTLRGAEKAFKLGTQGVKTTGSEQEKIVQKWADLGKELGKEMNNRRQQIGRAFKYITKRYDKGGGEKIDISEIDDLMKKVDIHINDPIVPKGEKTQYYSVKDYLQQLRDGIEQDKLVADQTKIAKAQDKERKILENLQAAGEAQTLTGATEAPQTAEEALKQQAARVRENMPGTEFQPIEQKTDELTGKKLAIMQETPESALARTPSGSEEAATQLKLIQDVIPPNATDVQVNELPSGRRVAHYTDSTTGKVKTTILPAELNQTPLKVIQERTGGLGKEVSATQAYDIAQKVKPYSYTVEPEKIPAAKIYGELKDITEEGIKDAIPQLKPLFKEYGGLSKAQQAFGINLDDTPEEMAKKISGKLYAAFTGDPKPQEIVTIQQGMNELIKSSPQLAKRFVPRIKALGEQTGIVDITAQEGFTILGQVGGKTMSLANLAGRATGAIKRAGQEAATGIRATQEKIVNSMPEELKRQGSMLWVKGGAVGKRLATEFYHMAEKDKKGRQAALFTIMQNPEYRQLMGIDLSKDENKEESNGSE